MELGEEKAYLAIIPMDGNGRKQDGAEGDIGR